MAFFFLLTFSVHKDILNRRDTELFCFCSEWSLCPCSGLQMPGSGVIWVNCASISLRMKAPAGAFILFLKCIRTGQLLINCPVLETSVF